MPARKIENAIQLNDLLMNLLVTVLAVVVVAIVLIDYRRS
jgi:heme/copper-type cytochrome/quinol oxidase subunit 2